MKNLESFSRQELLKLIEVYAKNWLAHDGCWFLAVEEKFGIETAIELDADSWERFAVSEAKRIMKTFGIAQGGGLDALEKVLPLRLYSVINPQETKRVDAHMLVFRMLECRVQRTRQMKGLPDFPCKPVGTVEFTNFARTVDPRIKTKCIACPPDVGADASCMWEFTL